MFKYYDPKTQLMNIYKTLGFDTHEESINYKYLIRPIADFLDTTARKEFFDLNNFLALAYGIEDKETLRTIMEQEPNGSEILDFFLRTKGYTGVYATPWIYYVDLYLNTEQYQKILGTKKKYTDGSIIITSGDTVLKNFEFTLSSSDFISSGTSFVSRKKKFYSYSIGASQLKTGDVLTVQGFEKGIIVGIEEGRYAETLDDKINKLFDSFTVYKTYNKENMKQYVKDKHNVDVEFVSTDDILMIRDLSQTDDGLVFHDGGKVDVYYTENTYGLKTFVGNAISTMGTQVMTADSAYFPSFGNPLKDYKYPVEDIDLTAWGTYFDVNADNFIIKDLYYIEMSPEQIPDMLPILGIESITNSNGQILQYNTDYIYISVDRGYTFSDKNKILIFFKTNPGTSVSIQYIVPLKYKEIKEKIINDPYIVPIGIDLMVKVRPVVFAQLTGTYTGIISDIGVNSEIAHFYDISINRLVQILKTNGAQNLAANKISLTAHTYSLGRYTKTTTNPQYALKMDDFSGEFPFDKTTDFAIMAIDPKPIVSNQ